MEPTEDRRRRRRRIVLVGVIASLALPLGSFALVQANAEAAWSEMTRRSEALRSDLEKRSRQRIPLYGEAIDGSAFEHYATAAAQVEPFADNNYEALRQLLPHDGEFDAATAAELRPRWRPMLAALRAGAHARDAGTLLRGDTPAYERIVNLLTYRWTANIATFEARALRREGNDLESVHVTLDAATMGADLVREGILINQMIGLALVAIATSEAWPETALATLSPKALAELSRGLERLDEAMPECLVMEHEMLFMADNLQRVPDQREWCGGGTWRYGFSSRWMCADAFVELTTSFENVASPPAASWPERQRQLESKYEALAATDNPVATLMVPNLLSAEQNLRESITLIRLLRTSVDLHQNIDVTAPADPLGSGPLRIQKSNDATIIRSAGSSSRRRFERIVTR